MNARKYFEDEFIQNIYFDSKSYFMPRSPSAGEQAHKATYIILSWVWQIQSTPSSNLFPIYDPNQKQ